MINLGTEAIDALKALRESEPWQAVHRALLEASRKAMHTALDTTSDERDVAVGYARALRDMFVAFEAAATGQQHNRVEKPGPVGKTYAAR